MEVVAAVVVLVAVFVCLSVAVLVAGAKAAAVEPRESVTAAEQHRPPLGLQAAMDLSAQIDLVYKRRLRDEDDERFEDWVRRHFGETIDKQLLTRVAGLTFVNADGSSRQALISRCRKYQRLRLVAEPDNPHDPRAIRVETLRGMQLGYLPRSVYLPFGVERWEAVVRAVNLADSDTPASLIVCVLRKVQAAVVSGK